MASEDELHRRLDNINRRLDRLDLRGVRANAGQARNAASWASLPAAYPRNTNHDDFNAGSWTTYVQSIGCNNRGVPGVSFQVYDVTGPSLGTGAPAFLWASGITNSDGYGSFRSLPPSPSNHFYSLGAQGAASGPYQGLVNYTPVLTTGIAITANFQTMQIAAPQSGINWGCLVGCDAPVWLGNLLFTDPFNSGHFGDMPFIYHGTVFNGTSLISGQSYYQYNFDTGGFFGGVAGPGLGIECNAQASGPFAGYLLHGTSPPSSYGVFYSQDADTWATGPMHASFSMNDPPAQPPCISVGFGGAPMVVTVDENP